MPVFDNEIHCSRRCQCMRYGMNYNGSVYYVYSRNCVCGVQQNIPLVLPNGNINTHGVDIHRDTSCHYVYQTILQTSKEKQFKLNLYCCCKKFGRNTRHWLLFERKMNETNFSIESRKTTMYNPCMEPHILCLWSEILFFFLSLYLLLRLSVSLYV